MREGSGTNMASLARLPKYLVYLKMRHREGLESISSTIIAEDLHLHPVQVRKDLALTTNSGRPKTGYPMSELIENLESFLGYNNAHDAFLVGAGKLGRALLGFEQFEEYGLSILAAFDTDPALHGTEFNGKPVFPMEKLSNLVGRMHVQIGILTVPEEAAQSAADLMVNSGIRAIWNFTTANLAVPEDVVLQNENLASSFAVLSGRLAEMTRREELEGGGLA